MCMSRGVKFHQYYKCLLAYLWGNMKTSVCVTNYLNSNSCLFDYILLYMNSKHHNLSLADSPFHVRKHGKWCNKIEACFSLKFYWKSPGWVMLMLHVLNMYFPLQNKITEIPCSAVQLDGYFKHFPPLGQWSVCKWTINSLLPCLCTLRPRGMKFPIPLSDMYAHL